MVSQTTPLTTQGWHSLIAHPITVAQYVQRFPPILEVKGHVNKGAAPIRGHEVTREVANCDVRVPVAINIRTPPSPGNQILLLLAQHE